MASGNTLLIFRPADNEPPAANYATFGVRNNHPVLQFDPATQQAAVFTAVLPRHYAGGGITAYLHWSAATAVAGNVGWLVAIERIGAVQDIDVDAFGADVSVQAAVPATSGAEAITSAAGVPLGGLAVGEAFRLRIRRDVTAAGNAAGAAELLAVELKET